MPVDIEQIITSSFEEQVALEDLTQEVLEGSGVFDVLMRTVSNHLEKEHSSNRITGDQYATAYITLSGNVLTQSIQFLLGVGKLKIEQNLTNLQLAKLQKEIDLVCQRVVTEKTQVMDQTVLDPCSEDSDSYVVSPAVGVEGEEGYVPEVRLNNSVQAIGGTIGRKNLTIDRQRQAYDDDYKNKVSSTIANSHRTLLSNIIDIGELPKEFTSAAMDQLVEHLKIDSGIVNDISSDTKRTGSNDVNDNQIKYSSDVDQ